MNEWVTLENNDQYFSRYKLTQYMPSVHSRSPSEEVDTSALRQYVVIQKFTKDKNGANEISISGIQTEGWKCEQYTLSPIEFKKLQMKLPDVVTEEDRPSTETEKC